VKKKKSRFSISDIRPENIFWPGIDSGIHQLSQESIKPVVLPQAVDLNAIVAASGLEHRHHITDFYNRSKRFRIFPYGIAFPTLIIAAENISIHKSIVKINDKYLINGPSGLRIINRLSRSTNKKRMERVDNIAKSFADKRINNNICLPDASESDRNLDLILVAKNLFNFYHFTKEALPNLALYESNNLTGNIIINSQNKTVAKFVKEGIEKFFPELANRVFLSFGNINVHRALLPIDTRFFYYQGSDESMPSLGAAAKVSWMWEDRALGERSLKTLGMNSCETSLFAFRKRVLQRVDETRSESDFTSKSRRLYVARRPSQRLRVIKQENELISTLTELDFEVIYFEDYDVLTQARLVSQAEVIVTAHGAGLTNMLYTQPGCLVVEISNLQIALLRFGDFNPLALVSQAKYLHFFTDHDWPNQDVIPDYGKHSLVGSKLDHMGISILRSAILAHLHPTRHDELMKTAADLNSNGNFEELESFFLLNFDRMMHEADAHVWAANCAAFRSNLQNALDCLGQASRLAPQRRPLLERSLNLAHRLEAHQKFDHLAFGYFRYHYETAVDFFAKHGWDSSSYLKVLDADIDVTALGDEKSGAVDES
tara:strand:- start:3034 stop:4833 length:1800 start_codon:yes stop_codon:yes gene_type:complete